MGMFALYGDVNFHLPSFNGLLFISIKPKGRRQISGSRHYVDILLKYYIKTVAYFSKIYCHTYFQGFISNSDNAASISQIRMSAILFLPVVVN
jgi:hypothetical protein